MHNHRCSCGGIMVLGTKRNETTGKDEIWHICPFCQSQQPTKGALAQRDLESDTILTQPASHP